MASATNSFSAMFEKMSNRVPGMKGELEEASSGSVFVDVFSKLTQTSTWEDVLKMTDDMVSEYNMLVETNKEEATSYLVDMIKIWAFKRDPHSKGEGNRLSSYYYFLSLAMKFPGLIRALIMEGMIETYGNWKDMRRIIRAIHTIPGLTPSQKMRYFDYPVVSAIRKHLMEKRSESLQSLDRWLRNNLKVSLGETTTETIRQTVRKILNDGYSEEAPKLPLLGKYIVSEKGSDNKEAYWFVKEGSNYCKVSLVNYLVRYSLKARDCKGNDVPFPARAAIPFSVFKAYRQANAKHKAALDLFESYFPRGEADQIDLSRVASKAKWNMRKALLNENVKGDAPREDQTETGNRYPTNKARVACRKNTRAYYLESAIKNMQTKSILPHQILYKLYTSKSVAEQEMFCGMWNAKVSQYRDRIANLDALNMEDFNEKMSGILKGNIIPVVDTSGSMSWTGSPGNRPLDIALGLSTFLSEIASEPYKNKAITFSSQPHIVNLCSADGKAFDLKTRYSQLLRGSGYSTDFYATNKLLAELCNNNRVSEEDLPVLVIFSDEGWDTQTGMKPTDYRTHHEKLVQLWMNYGYSRMPTYVYWNLRSDSSKRGFQTKSDFPGVMFLQGSSPNLFDLVMYGEMTPVEETEVVIDGQSHTIKTNTITPEQNFRNAMSLPKFYDPLLLVLERML